MGNTGKCIPKTAWSRLLCSWSRRCQRWAVSARVTEVPGVLLLLCESFISNVPGQVGNSREEAVAKPFNPVFVSSVSVL